MANNEPPQKPCAPRAHLSIDERIELPLNDFVRELATQAAWIVIKEHTSTCPIKNVDERMHKMENRFNLLLGAIVGSGALGGAVAATLLKAFGQ